MKDELKKYDLITQYSVHWGEMDAARHINNLVYLRWAESARIIYFEKAGMAISFSGDVGPILGWQECKYIFPMTYPDKAIVGVRVIEIKEDRFIMESAVFSDHHQRIAAISRQAIIPYDYIGLKKIPMPQSWLEGIEGMKIK